MLPFSLILALSAIFIRIDTIMIGQLVKINTDNQLTLYGNAYRQLDALNMVGFLFSGLLLPMFSKLISRKLEIRQLTRMSLGFLSVITICVAFPMSIWAEQVMNLLYHQSTPEWGKVFSILVLSFIPMSISYIFGNILLANNNLREINILYFGGVLCNIILNYFAINHFQSYGAAVTTLFTQIVILCGLFFICKRKGLIDGINIQILKILFLMILSWGISFYAYTWSTNLFFMLIVGGIVFIISLLLKLINPKEILQTFKRDN